MVGINDTSNGQCGSHLNVAGEDFRCDLAAEHDGWSHSNKAASALWQN